MTTTGPSYGTTPVGSTNTDPSQASVGQLVAAVTGDISTLMRKEFELARAELSQEADKAKRGAGLLGGAAVAAHMLALFASLAVMFLLDEVMPRWLAAALVALVYAGVAAALFSKGRQQMKTVDPKPRQTVETLKEDVQWAKNQTR